MIDRRHAIGLLSGTVLSTALSVPLLAGRQASASSQDSDRERREGRDAPAETLLYLLPLVVAAHQLAIRRVFILGATQLFLLRADAGVDQFSEKRMGLDFIPFLGGLTRRTYGPKDFTDASRLGAAYVEGAAMFIYLFPHFFDPKVRQFVFLNLASSFVLRDIYNTSDWAALASLMPVLCTIETVRRAVSARLGLPRSTGQSADPGLDMDHLAMAGLLTDETGGQGRIPALHDIPALRTAFAGHVFDTSDNKLLVLIRPSIVMGDT